MNKFLGMMTTVVALTAATTASADYYGGWLYDDNPGGREITILGNGNGYGLYLTGYTGACGPRGASYATMRNVMSETGGGWISWWIDQDCGSTVRVCVQNDWGQWACSSYYDHGWVEFR